ncbi:MAG: hypothetical protein L0G99_10035 [Propionibacteriales bacterium]|nr:hypothetical protein [Propionibacteriales bacterium]
MTLERRALLRLGVVGVTAGVVGCRAGGSTPGPVRCVPRSALTSTDQIDGKPLLYEENGRQQRFALDATFLEQVIAWQRWWRTESGLGDHDQLWTYGTWIDGGGTCDSRHNEGRALDISRLTAGKQPIVSGRYDLWSKLPSGQVTWHTRRYWSLAASLHAHFAYVLTHLFDDLHANHIHVDNARSPDGIVQFEPGSRAQCQALQAICTHLWDIPVEQTGEWDRPTRRASTTVAERAGGTGDAARGDNWQLIMKASAGRAAALT